MRWAVIGDVGGHVDELRAELTRLGIDPGAASMPRDLSIVQVGDLIHRGPASGEVIDLVDRLIRGNPGRWIQLMGNHEAQYVRRPAFDWPDRLTPESIETLRGWWAQGRMVVAACVPTPYGDALVTHAGVTEEFWRRDLGAPRSAADAARKLNEAGARGADELFRPGVMLTGKVSLRAGPLWAEVCRELIPSWEWRPMPFSQVHGHTSLVDWRNDRWRTTNPAVERTTLDWGAAHETTEMVGGVIVGVDPDHGAEATTTWRAWEPADTAA